MEKTVQTITSELLAKPQPAKGSSKPSLDLNTENCPFVMSMIAHEMRGPLNNIGILAGMLKAELGSAALNENTKQYLKAIEQVCGDTGSLLEELLDLSMLEFNGAAGCDLQPHNPRMLFADCIEGCAESAVNKEIGLETFIGPGIGQVVLDGPKFRLAVGNLLSNAIKFSKRGQQVLLEGSSMPCGGFRVKVEDRGVGIPAELSANVFKKFSRSRRHGTQGEKPHGLGLAIVKLVAEAHGGRVWFEPVLPKGTVFYIEFPRKQHNIE